MYIFTSMPFMNSTLTFVKEKFKDNVLPQGMAGSLPSMMSGRIHELCYTLYMALDVVRIRIAFISTST